MVVVRKRSRLPHWDIEGGQYFVTFCLSGAISASERERIEIERRRRWEAIHKLRGSVSRAEDARLNLWVLREIERVLDRGDGEALLRNSEIAELTANALQFFDGARYDLLAWCVMPTHVHVAFRLFESEELFKVMKSWKAYTGRRANELLGRSGSFWQEDYWDRGIRSERHLKRVLRYIENNPILAGLHDWRWVHVYRERLGAVLV